MLLTLDPRRFRLSPSVVDNRFILQLTDCGFGVAVDLEHFLLKQLQLGLQAGLLSRDLVQPRLFLRTELHCD